MLVSASHWALNPRTPLSHFIMMGPIFSLTQKVQFVIEYTLAIQTHKQYKSNPMFKRLGFAGVILAHSAIQEQLSAAESDPHFSRNATCILQSAKGSTVKGIVSFTQSSIDSSVKVASSLRGLAPTNLYTLYIHESGQTTKGENGMGDPYPKQFMLSADPKSKWDLEVLTANYRGSNYGTTETNRITLYGDKSVVGRSIAVRHLTKSRTPEGKETKKLTLEASGIIGLTRDFLTLRPL